MVIQPANSMIGARYSKRNIAAQVTIPTFP